MTALSPAFCKRLAGGSIRDCACRLPNKGGWLDCPRDARGVLEPVDPGPAPRPPTRPIQYPAVLPAQVAEHAMPSPTGEFCECGGMMVRTGTCQTCQSCGSSSGGCG